MKTSTIINDETEERIINGLSINLRQVKPYTLKLTSNAYAELRQLKKLCKKYRATLTVIAKSQGINLQTGEQDCVTMSLEDLTGEWTPLYVRVSDPVCQMLEHAGMND